jgi:hypothetical protein
MYFLQSFKCGKRPSSQFFFFVDKILFVVVCKVVEVENFDVVVDGGLIATLHSTLLALN